MTTETITLRAHPCLALRSKGERGCGHGDGDDCVAELRTAIGVLLDAVDALKRHPCVTGECDHKGLEEPGDRRWLLWCAEELTAAIKALP
jgi:hypothetical protein